jgi:hypothetical protein
MKISNLCKEFEFCPLECKIGVEISGIEEIRGNDGGTNRTDHISSCFNKSVFYKSVPHMSMIAELVRIMLE